MTSDLRTRNRERAREELGRAALSLLLEQGYAQVTSEAIAARAGMALRTLYRHYSSKDEVVVGYLHRSDAARQDRLRQATGSSALHALLDMVEFGLERDAEWLSSDTLVAITKMIIDEPSLRAANLRLLAQHQTALVDILVERADYGPGRRTDARLTVAAFYGALHLAEQDWLSEPTSVRDLVGLVREYVGFLPKALRTAAGQEAQR